MTLRIQVLGFCRGNHDDHYTVITLIVMVGARWSVCEALGSHGELQLPPLSAAAKRVSGSPVQTSLIADLSSPAAVQDM